MRPRSTAVSARLCGLEVLVLEVQGARLAGYRRDRTKEELCDSCLAMSHGHITHHFESSR